MAVREYETEQGLEDEFDRICEKNDEHLRLKEEIEDAEGYIEDCKSELTYAIENLIESRKRLREAEQELLEFEEENGEFLVG